MSGVGENKNRGDKRRVAASERERVSPSLREKRRCNPVEILPERDCVRRISRSAGKWMTCGKSLRRVSAEVLRLVCDTAALKFDAGGSPDASRSSRTLGKSERVMECGGNPATRERHRFGRRRESMRNRSCQAKAPSPRCSAGAVQDAARCSRTPGKCASPAPAGECGRVCGESSEGIINCRICQWPTPWRTFRRKS